MKTINAVAAIIASTVRARSLPILSERNLTTGSRPPGHQRFSARQLQQWALLYASVKAMASVVPHDEPRAASNQANAVMIPASSSLLLSFPDARRLPRNHPAPAGHALFLTAGNENAGRGELARDAQMAALEAILFLADEPLTVKRLAQVLRLADGAEARRQVRRLQALYEKENAAFEIVEVAGGFQLLTKPIFYRWLSRMPKPPSELR